MKNILIYFAVAGFLLSPTVSFAVDNASTMQAPSVNSQQMTPQQANQADKFTRQDTMFQNRGTLQERGTIQNKDALPGSTNTARDSKSIDQSSTSVMDRSHVDKDLDVRHHDKYDRSDRRDRDRGSIFSFFTTDSSPDITVVKSTIRDDSALAPYAEKVDFLQCDNNLILFGVVPSEAIKNQIELKVKDIEGVSSVQNRIVVQG